MQPRRLTARFDAPPPEAFSAVADIDEYARLLKGSEGPARLAIEVRDALSSRIDGVNEDVLGLHAAMGAFEVRQGKARVRVVLLWLGPPHRFWLAWLSPHRRWSRRRREADLALADELQPVMQTLLSECQDIRHVVWMSEAEAQAFPL